MIGLIIELIISWLLVWFLYKKDLSVLGLRPTKSRLGNLAIGFLAATLCCCIYFLSQSALTHSSWAVNKAFTLQAFAKSSWWTFKSVLYEELIFRGVLLYILIRKTGIRTACIMSAVAFGIYHWFVTGAWGHPVQMAIIFFMTAIWGLMFAFAFAKTNSLYLPVGLHFGWNLINIVIFSKGPLGHQLLIGNDEEKLTGILMICFFVFQVFALPLLTFLYLNKQTKDDPLSWIDLSAPGKICILLKRNDSTHFTQKISHPSINFIS
jgi:membrane protease YdiL (CAAX protease family)